MTTQTCDIKIKRIKYQDTGTGFAIVEAQPSQATMVCNVFKGYFHQMRIATGMTLHVTAKLASHPKWGTFWEVTQASIPIMRQNARHTFKMHMEAYLQDMVRSRVVDTVSKCIPLDDDTFWDNFTHDPEILYTLCPSHMHEDVKSLIAAWLDFRQHHNVFEGLIKIGITPSQIAKIFETLGEENAIQKIEENPYCLLWVDTIKFSQADAYATEIKGYTKDNPRCITYMLYAIFVKILISQGHIYLTIQELEKESREILEREGQDAFYLDYLPECLKTWQDDHWIHVTPEGHIYESMTYGHELAIVDYITDRLRTPITDTLEVSQILDLETRHGIELSDTQRDAVYGMLTNRMYLLTGLPGTGKSTVMKIAYAAFRQKNLHIVMLAPTGIAAQRLSYTSGADALTVHAFLGYKGQDSWTHGESHPVRADVVIVDEVSMMGQNLLYRLLSALPLDCQVILTGDSEQLPSVDQGYVLHDLISSGVIPRSHFTEIFRQEHTSAIVTAAHAISNGTLPPLDQPKSDFVFIQENDAFKAQVMILEAASKLYQLSQKTDVSYQVIAPLYAGPLGVDALNTKLRDMLNPPHPSHAEKTFGFISLREGDRVMCVRNDSALGVYNGEIGKVAVLDGKAKELRLKMYGLTPQDHRVVSIPYNQVTRMIRPAMCVTTHKSQGQEWDIVVLALHPQHGKMLQRQLVYTAITRARKRVIVIGSWQSLHKAIQVTGASNRNTQLGSRLKASCHSV
jgi:exodeoxyribonuclease V alpha subunit